MRVTPAVAVAYVQVLKFWTSPAPGVGSAIARRIAPATSAAAKDAVPRTRRR